MVPVCEKNGILAFRVDDVFRPGIIMQDIIQALIESDIIIAEISSEKIPDWDSNAFPLLVFREMIDIFSIYL